MFWKYWVDLNRKNESWTLVSRDHKNLVLECPHGCIHDQFCMKFPNHHYCMCIMEIMRHPLYPRIVGQTLTYIMSSRSTSLESKSQLTINLDPGWECQSLPSEDNKKKERKGENSWSKESEESKKRKFPIKDWEKAKWKKIPDQRSEENRRNM